MSGDGASEEREVEHTGPGGTEAIWLEAMLGLMTGDPVLYQAPKECKFSEEYTTLPKDRKGIRLFHTVEGLKMIYEEHLNNREIPKLLLSFINLMEYWEEEGSLDINDIYF